MRMCGSGRKEASGPIAEEDEGLHFLMASTKKLSVENTLREVSV